MTKLKSIRKIKLPKGEIIPLKTDFMFCHIFNDPENIEIVEGFIASYLNLSLEEVHNKIKVLTRKIKIENKLQADNEVDLLLDLDKEKINIEISNALDDGIKNRNVVFLSKIHAKNIKYGETNAYNNIQKSLQINLVSHNINESDLIETFYLRNDKGKKLTEKLQIDYIDMAKADKVCYNENTKEEKIRKWCLLIMTKSKKEFKKYLKESNIMSEEAKRKLKSDVRNLSEDDDYVMWYSKYTRQELEHYSIMENAKNAEEKGFKKGYKEGKEKGYEEGKEKGIEKGIEKGSNKEKIDIAKKLLKYKMSNEDISKITGLSINQIKEIK